MTTRPPADAIVALRSLGRRWRGLFAGLDEDESPDALARRPGDQGRAALDHAAHATGTLRLLDRALELILVDEGATLDAAVTDPGQRSWPTPGSGVEEAIDDLAAQAERIADRADRAAPADWSRRAGGVDALTVLWDAVDSAVADLRAAEATLREVRGRSS